MRETETLIAIINLKYEGRQTLRKDAIHKLKTNKQQLSSLNNTQKFRYTVFGNI